MLRNDKSPCPHAAGNMDNTPANSASRHYIMILGFITPKSKSE